MPWVCRNCGTRLPEGDEVFCPGCHADVRKELGDAATPTDPGRAQAGEVSFWASSWPFAAPRA
jgi:predicted  nucleic acid-binding Zn-ribbon protein